MLGRGLTFETYQEIVCRLHDQNKDGIRTRIRIRIRTRIRIRRRRRRVLPDSPFLSNLCAAACTHRAK